MSKLVSYAWLNDKIYQSYATPRQLEIMLVVFKHTCINKASKELKIDRSVVFRTLKAVKLKASVQGYAPEFGMIKAFPPGYVGKGHSSLDRINPDGSRTPVLEWRKSKADEKFRAKQIEEGFVAAAESLPRLPPIKNISGDVINELCNVITITDYHLGMKAWALETGSDWNVEIAEKMLSDAFVHLIVNAPKAKKLIINIQGDFLHADGPKALTPTSGHLLDVDGRYGETVKAAIRVLRKVIDAALWIFEEVEVLFCEGNHDISGSMWLRYMFAAIYEKEPRITVHDCEKPYYAIKHGLNMLAFHHGHLAKNESLPLIFAAMYSQVWGETKYRYVHTGHMHHLEEKEYSGMTVRRHRTLSPNDANSARGGYNSERSADCATYHLLYGEVARNFVNPEMLRNKSGAD